MDREEVAEKQKADPLKPFREFGEAVAKLNPVSTVDYWRRRLVETGLVRK